MADAPHQQITLTVDGTTYKAAFKRHPDVPDYPARLIGPFGAWEESLPLPMDGFLPERSVEVRFRNYDQAPTYGPPSAYGLPTRYSGGFEATLDGIRLDGTLIGQTAMARLRNVSGGSDIRRIDGVVTEEGDTDNTSGTFRIGTVDTALFEQELPRQKIRDLFAAAVLTRGSIEEADPPVYVCCGVSRKVPLVQLVADGTKWGVVRSPASGTLTWTTVYLNKAVLLPSEYTVTTETIDGKSVKYITLDDEPNADEQILMHADLTSTEFRNTLEFVKFLLSDPDYGLSPAQSVNAAAFTTESNVLHALSYAATGGLYERFPAQDLFLQLLVRGTYLSRNTSNEWYPVVDQASAHPASSLPFQMGASGGVQTIIPDSLVSRRGNVHDLTKTLEVGFAFDPGFDGSGKYLGLATKTVTQLGTVRRWDNPFLDRTTAEKECGYALSALRLQDRVLDCDIDLRGQALVLGEVVTANIPHRTISGSRMIRSLGMSWSGDEASAHISGGYSCSTVPYDASIYTATADPADTVLLPGAAEVTDYSHTVPGPGTSFAAATTTTRATDGTVIAHVTLTVTPPAVNRTDIIFVVYPNGSAVSKERRVIEITGAGAHTTTFDLEPGLTLNYQAVILNSNNVDGKRSSTPVTLSAQSTGAPVAPAVPQNPSATAAIESIVLDWDDNTESDFSEYQVFRANGDSFPGGTPLAEVRASQFIDGLAGTTRRYYWIKAVNTTELKSAATSSVNATGSAGASTTAPSNPAAISKNAEGTYNALDGTAFSFIVVNVPGMPSGASVINILYRRNGTSQYQIADQLSSGSGTSRVDDLTPGVQYEFAAQAWSSGAGASAIIGASDDPYTAVGDTTAPGTVASVAATAGTGKSIEASWTVLADATLAEYIIYRNTSANPGSDSDPAVHEHARVRTNRFTDTNVAYSTTYHYRVKAIDHSGNVSSAFSNNASAAVTKVDTPDIEDGAVQNLQVHNDLSAAKITTGDLTVTSGNVRISATGDSAISINFGSSFAKIKWWASAFSGDEAAHIGAGDVFATHGFKGMQLVVRNTSYDIRLGTSGERFANLGLFFDGDIKASEHIFDGTTAAASSSTVTVTTPSGTTALALPNRRIKIDTTTGGPYYIWCSES